MDWPGMTFGKGLQQLTFAAYYEHFETRSIRLHVTLVSSIEATRGAL